MIHLEPQWLELTQKILRFHIPERRVVIFGSRATGVRLKPHSDIDLCIMGDVPVDITIMGDLRDFFSASRLPMRVDLVDWASTSPTFRAIIEKDAQEFPLS